MGPNVGDENSLQIRKERMKDWKVVLTLGLIRLYYLWREARKGKSVQNASIDAKSSTQPGAPRKKRS